MKAFPDWQLRLLQTLDKALPLVRQPFAQLAHEAGIEEQRLLEQVRAWVADGTIRRFGARVNHRSVGYVANGMSVWNVPPDQVEKAGAFMARQPEVSHCYLRPTVPGWEYNLFAMIHGHTEAAVRAVADRIAKHVGLSTYEVLFSTREFKKSAPQYFPGK